MTDLETALAELRRQHRQLDAPSHLAATLCAAVEPGARWYRPALAAAVLIAAALWQSGGPQPAQASMEFVPVPGSESLPPPIETTVLRMQLTRSDLVQYGFDLPPSNDPVTAELIVGDDGLARAVRLRTQP